ncbi:unnamed protein product [Merluccius merluccius]
METVVGKHEGLSQQRCHGICPGAEAGSGVFTNRPPTDLRLQSPTDFSSMYSSQASSRESVFSEGWDRERSWSAMQLSDAMSPLSRSRAVSPCSSVRSGAFTPTVVRVRRHALATGSSLLHMPQPSCLSSCESLASSVGGAQSPPPPTRRRPPLTRLSLLTAILRKGRLPVLSSALQRPYSPCWPINHITLASCTACSAASSLAPVSPLSPTRSPLSPRSPRSPLPPSLVPTDAPTAQSHSHRDSFRCRPALPSVHIKDSSGPRVTETSASDRHYLTGKEPKFQTVFSRPVRSPIVHRATGGGRQVTLAQAPLPPLPSPTSQVSAATANVANLAKPNERTESTGLHRSTPWWCARPSSPTPERGANQTDHRSPVDNSQHIAQTKLKQSSPGAMGAGNVSVARQACSPPPLPATARLDCISPQPTSLQSCLKKTQAFAPHSHSAPVSELPKYTVTQSPVLGNTSILGPSRPDSPRDKISSAPSSSCLSPSRYAPIVFPGWPSPNSSRTSTPDRFTLTPSPASLRDLTPCPSPSPSLRSTPSPRPGSGKSECTYREGKKMKVIDERVDAPCGTSGVEDPHTEMCSPAQLRQESEELYAVIDKILEDAIPKSKTSSSSAKPSRESSPTVTGLKPQTDSLRTDQGRKDFHWQ